MSKGQRSENHPSRRVPPERFRTGDKGPLPSNIKTHRDYPPEHGVPITQAEAYQRSRRFGEPDDDE